MSGYSMEERAAEMKRRAAEPSSWDKIKEKLKKLIQPSPSLGDNITDELKKIQKREEK